MFDISYLEFPTDWRKLLRAFHREMEDDSEARRSYKNLSPTAPNDQMERDRESGMVMPPLSPLPARSVYTDQIHEANDISKTFLGVNGRDSIAKMKYVAKFLQSMPSSGHDREYLSDTDAPPRHLDRYPAMNWKNSGAAHEKLAAGFSPREKEFSSPRDQDFASDGYSSSEGTKEEPIQNGHRKDYYISRSPHMEGKVGNHFDATDGRNGFEGEKHKQFQNYLNQTGGYDLDLLDPESRYHSSSGKRYAMMPSEDNPLAAMLQKFAVSGDSERFPVSPLKNVAAITASLFPGKGLPKKRRFRDDMIFPTPISYGLSPLHGSAGMPMGGAEKGSNHPDVFICHICSFVATSNDEFKTHMMIHYDYQCPQCTYSSRTEGRLKRHIKDFHGAADMSPGREASPDGRQPQKTNQPKKFKCRQCNFISLSREEHWRHITVHIKTEKQLKCIHCPFVTEFKHHLEYHIRNHNNSKPYKCGKCNYTCVNKSMLNSHMKSHTNVYQFRCASCKYATKYSHSLKLHLINKKHLPAVVLNPDGSLPTDGTGSFELISKRGPPRGPRGPRKPKLISDDASPPALMPIFPSNSPPMMSFGQGSDYPWIPSQNSKPLNGVAIPGALPPINGALLSSAGSLPSQSLGYPLNILSQLSNSVMPSSSDRVMAGSGAAAVPCGFCPAAFSSLTLLAEHVKIEHAQKLGGFGVKLESKSPLQESAAVSCLDQTPCEKKNYNGEGFCHVQGLTSSPEMEMFSSRNVDLRPNKTERANESAPKKRSVSETVEIPLDLSSKNPDELKRATKRGAVDADEDDSSRTVSPSVTAMARKRSRKGKACKLDELSLKLQDHWKEEDGPLEGSESSSLDGDCQPSQKVSAVVSKEVERKFFEVACSTSSPPPPAGSLNDSSSWSWKKESPQYSDADSSDQLRGDKSNGNGNGKAESRRRQSPKPADLSDQEPGSDSNTNSSEGFTTSCTKSSVPARQPPDNGYYTCNYCDMGFRDNVTHFLHMGYHTFDDPFKCNKCGHRSTDAVDFFVHMARVAHTQ